MKNKTCNISKDMNMSDVRPVKKDSNGNKIFQDFREYWHFTKCLNQNQRDLIFASLPIKQQTSIRNSYSRGSWGDVLMRDAINGAVDNIKKESGYDMLAIRCKVMSGKSAYMPRVIWEQFVTEAKKFSLIHSYFVFGGIRGIVCENNNDVVLVVKSNIPTEE